jgi:hypothetical protein
MSVAVKSATASYLPGVTVEVQTYRNKILPLTDSRGGYAVHGLRTGGLYCEK